MWHVSYTIDDAAALRQIVTSREIRTRAEQAASVLVQVYCADPDAAWITAVVDVLDTELAGAVVVGATTIGEVVQGLSLTGKTVIGFTFFDTTRLSPIALACPAGQEYEIGTELGRQIRQCCQDVAGVLLLSTPLSLRASHLLSGFELSRDRYPVFGGGAGVYEQSRESLVFWGDRMFSQGVVAVVLTGTDLHVESRTYLGWLELSKEMTVTEVEDMLVKTIDNEPAFDVYQRYLDIPNDEQFFLNSLEFPVLLQRQERVIARVPVSVNERGEVQFVADIVKGEKFRFGYGNPDLIIGEAVAIRNVMRDFSPDALFLYTCGCRRFLMQQAVEKETLPFEAIAPTFGFYTYGEFFGGDKPIELLNSTMVAVGLREGPARTAPREVMRAQPESQIPHDPYADKHSRIVSRLVHFIGAVTSELEQANREITQLSLTDRLTQLNNRMKLDASLGENVALAMRYKQQFSVILLDVDHFKQVNDTHGHLIGDDVLVRVARVLVRNVRESDIVGRWGGEEFLLVLPQTEVEQASALAEKLRRAIAEEPIPVVGHMTASFGVTSYHVDESIAALLARADDALYQAKRSGRNRVQASL